MNWHPQWTEHVDCASVRPAPGNRDSARQLRDWKGIATAENMSPKRMALFGRLCGATLARAHARSGDRIAIAAYLGSSDAFERALATFAELYADQNEKDHQALVDAIRTGRVPAEAG